VPPVRASVASSPAANRILPLTRGVAAVLGAIVFAAFVVLYFFPSRTAQLFAWNVQPPMTAMFMGASYANGTVFFASVLFGRKWHRVWAPHLGVAIFAALLMIATLLHWEKFNHTHPVFWAWIGVYSLAPVVVPWALWRNRGEDPGTPEPGDPLVPLALRRVWLVPGALFVLAATAAFVDPAWLIALWPWKATPLTLRVMVSFYSMLGVAVFTVQREPRWSAWRAGAWGVLTWHALVLVAAGLRRQDFLPGSLHLGWFAFEAALVLGTLATILYMERGTARRR
jgi:hypothetical protein